MSIGKRGQILLKIISHFSFEQHTGEYKTWPKKTRLLRDGKPTGVELPGYSLLHQFELTDKRVLLIADWDCPFEETTEILLLSPQLTLLERKSFIGFYCSFVVRDLQILGPDSFTLDFNYVDFVHKVTILKKRRWLFGNRILVRKIPRPPGQPQKR